MKGWICRAHKEAITIDFEQIPQYHTSTKKIKKKNKVSTSQIAHIQKRDDFDPRKLLIVNELVKQQL